MNKTKENEMKVISPIAIDMGAKNTGVYYAKYEQGSSFEQIEKQGQVLVYDKYTALLKDRTANRHARRGYQRKKLAKRWLVLVLENYFKFPAKQHTQAIGFLLNRRGFTFLDEQYSKAHLDNLPEAVGDKLSDEVRTLLGCEKEKIADTLIDLASNKPEKITSIFNAIRNIEGYKKFQEEKAKIKKEFVYFDYIEKIYKACDIIVKNEKVTDDKVTKNNKGKQKLSKTANWIIERLNKKNNFTFTADETSQTDLIKQITQLNSQQLQQGLPNFITARKQINNEQTENNKSIWNFNITKFEFNDKNETGLAELNSKIHLHHFCYAIYKINHEIISGARHRSKYFEEIKEDLEKFTSNDFLDNRHSPKYLVEFAKALKDNKQLNSNKLTKLICHISNFELKPLRAYFNDKTPIKKGGKEFISHKNGDKYNLEKLSRLTSVWFLKNWRVNEEKDNKQKVKDYKDLRNLWKNHGNKNDVVAFWLNTCPILTIPPYQSMNNRRPPKCQTLLLNGKYLNNHYPQWKAWLEELEPDKDYKEKLQNLLSGKGKQKNHDGRLISDDLIQLRQLQFILDTAKKRDKYKLNEIWSIHHKLQQLKDSSGDTEEIEKWQNDLKKVKEKSKLPDEQKQDLNFNVPESFGHFINKYYQTRRKTKDGRYFLHQSKKDKWITDDKLLTVCTHKPKQKKHQWLIDLAAVLGIDSDKLKDKLNNSSPEEWLKEISGFKSSCDKAAKAQKDHRGDLKTKIDLAQKPKEKSKNKLKEKEQKELSGLASKCEKLSLELTGKLWQDLSENEQKKKADKFKSVFSFAQINNIVFKDRNGFSKTCPVCSTDNGFRMQENDEGTAKASRLPAMSIRLIDGLVMRICDAISRQVATTKWGEIKKELEQGEKISIPLIMEQNRFEFEPSLKVIKGKLKEKGKDGKAGLIEESSQKRDKQYSDKETRIKDAAHDICTYTGKPLSDSGEIDHIIPQASIYGTLNDEGNLIYVSRLANQNKGNQDYYLNDLHAEYKNKIFGDITDDQIKEFIYKQLEGQDAQVGVVENEDYFEFGRYLSFINLTNDQQITFRHALFLPDNDPLKQKVINALQNRNRTIVNGTQRYLAQCITDKLYKIARRSGKEKLIEFDYLEYSARADIPNSTYNLRKEYGLDKPKNQPLYSHLIDAQMAFLLAVDDHKNNGSMGIKFEDCEAITQEVNRKTGQILQSDKFFELSKVKEEQFSIVNLNPKTSKQKINDIEKQNSGKKQNLSKIFNRYVFKQNAIGERYRPIVKFKNEWYLGYPMTVKGGVYNCDEYCQKIEQSDIQKIKKIISDNKYYELTIGNEQIKIYTIKKVDKKYKEIDRDSHKYFSTLSQKYTEDEKEDIKHIQLILENCKYYVAKTEVINAPKVLSKFAEKTKDDKKSEWKYKKEIKRYPFYKNWIGFDQAWRDFVGNDYAIDNKGEKYILTDSEVANKWNDFCKKRFSTPSKQTKNRHKITGKKYTMISLGTASGTVFRVNRQNKDIYQAVPLDTNIISKDRSNFLIKHSKNLTLVSKTADKDLSKPVNTEEEFKLENYEIAANKFFKNDDKNLKRVRVYLNKTSANIENFPVGEFKSYFIRASKEDKELFDEIFDTNNKEQYPIKKTNIKDKIKITPRNDKDITNINIDTDKVNFSLPFKSKEIEKLATLSKNA